MKVFRADLGLLCAFFALNGCGGSGSGSSPSTGGSDFEVFEATLPDGSPMTLEVYYNTGSQWEGAFEVDATAGPYASQAGTFGGSISGKNVTAVCALSDGGTFQLVGIANGDAGMKLTRSDIPGNVLAFKPVAGTAAMTTGTFKITYTLGLAYASNMTGTAIFQSTPFDYGYMQQFSGTWQSFPIRLNVSDFGVVVTVDMRAGGISIGQYEGLTFGNVGKGTIQSTYTDLEIPNSSLGYYMIFNVSGTIAP